MPTMKTENRVTLYKMGARSEIREWVAWTEGCTLFLKHGEINSQKIVDTREFSTPEEASIHLQRRATKQQDRRGYTKHIPDTKPVLPMLALRYQDHPDKLKDTFYYQPKLDGYRAVGSQSALKSRTNNHIYSLPHIYHTLNLLPADVTLDGELYIHGVHFQQIMGARTISEPTKLHLQIEYHVYDIVDENVNATDRLMSLKELLGHLETKYNEAPFGEIPFPFKFVETTLGHKDHVNQYLEHYTKQGYEGVMFRDVDSKYEMNYRSPGLIKYKPIDKDTFKIIGTKPGPRDPTLGVLVCKTSNGTEFDVALKAPAHIKREIILTPEAFKGFAVEVEYTGLTLDGKPKCAVGTKVHRW